MRNLRLLLLSLLLGLISVQARATPSLGGSYELTKTLIGAAGNANSNSQDGRYAMAYALGEPAAGITSNSVPAQLFLGSGYFGGGYGNIQTFRMISSRVGTVGTVIHFQEGI